MRNFKLRLEFLHFSRRIADARNHSAIESQARRAKDSSPRREPWDSARTRAEPRQGRKNMPQTFASLLVHVIFSTKNRAPDLTGELPERLFPYMGGIVGGLKGVALIVNGPADHVHLLVSMPPAISVADLLRVLKTNSCRWVHEQFPERNRFGWQAGYGAFTVSSSRLEDVRGYIAKQQAQHQRVSFQEEFLALLKRHGLECGIAGAGA